MGKNILTPAGNDKRDVPCFSGDVDDVGLFPLILFGVLGTSQGVLSVAFLFAQQFLPAAGSFCFCVGLLGAFRYYYRLRKRLNQLHTAYSIAKQFGLKAADVVALEQSQQVKPVYCVNGVDLFDPADFDEAQSLLRASVQPTASQETLLRPAIGTEEAHSEHLLRAAHE